MRGKLYKGLSQLPMKITPYHSVDHRRMSYLSAFVLLSLFIVPGYSGRNKPAPYYIVDLDLPPELRWAQVAKDYSAYFPLLLKELEEMYPKLLIRAISDITAHFEDYFPYPYADEIRGIVKYSNNTVTLGQVVLGNIIYDLTAFRKSDYKTGKGVCTSIVASDSKGKIFHGRNLDYQFTKSLRDMVINVQFKKGNDPNYFMGTTFAGFIGLLTGCKPNGVSISLDERDTGEWWQNAISALKDGGHGLVSILIRDVLQQDKVIFSNAVDKLSGTPLIAPSYLIVAGPGSTDGVVITRERQAALDKWFLDLDNGDWFILETNYDRWKPPPSNDDRRDPGLQAMRKIGRDGINATSLLKVLSTAPVLNSETTYTTIMSPAIQGLYNTIIRLDD